MTRAMLRADNVLVKISESMLPKGSGQDGTGLWIRLDCRGYNYNFVKWKGKLVPREEAEHEANLAASRLLGSSDEDKYPWPEDLRSSTDVHILVFRPTNYTQIYSLVNRSWALPYSDAPWALQADHDSVWKTSGFKFLDEVVLQLKSNLGLPEGTGGFEYDITIANVDYVTMRTERVSGCDTPQSRRKITDLNLKGVPSLG